MELKHVTIHKYKSIENEQSFNVEKDITILVGMNESGKTSILEALAKSNYFQKDKKFIYSTTHDYPRKEKKKLDKSGEDPSAITCDYEVDDELVIKINKDLGSDVFTQKVVSVCHKFSNTKIWKNVSCNYAKFVENKKSALGISSKTLNDKLANIKNEANLTALIEEYKDATIVAGLRSLTKYYKNANKWDNPIAEYITVNYLSQNLPKYLYYDEYYALPSRINIENLQSEELDDE